MSIEKPVRNPQGHFLPGHSENSGRKKGSRNKLTNAFIGALHADFEEHGEAVIREMREDDPVAYVRVVASLVPKQLEQVPPEGQLSDDELETLIGQLLDAKQRLESSGISLAEIAGGERKKDEPGTVEILPPIR